MQVVVLFLQKRREETCSHVTVPTSWLITIITTILITMVIITIAAGMYLVFYLVVIHLILMIIVKVGKLRTILVKSAAMTTRRVSSGAGI